MVGLSPYASLLCATARHGGSSSKRPLNPAREAGAQLLASNVAACGWF